MLKIYQSIRALKLVTEISVDGEPVTIEFTNGVRQPKRRNGTYNTTSKKMQKALESSPKFNKSYKLVKTVGEQEPESVVEEIQEKEIQKESIEEIKKEDVSDNTEENDYSSITKAQDARDVLFNLDKTLTYNDVKSKMFIHNQAKRLNISFPNLV